MTANTTHMEPRDILEASRNLARKSRDIYKPALEAHFANLPGIPPDTIQTLVACELHIRMNLVMDCYLTGVEETLKRIAGDPTPEPFNEDYDHEARLRELLEPWSNPQ